MNTTTMQSSASPRGRHARGVVAWRYLICLTCLICFGSIVPSTTVRAQTIERFQSSGSAPSNILEGVAIPATSDLLLLSGQTASLPNTPDQPVTRSVTASQLGDTRAQTFNILGKIDATLARHGYRMSDVVKLTVYLVGDPAAGGRMDYAGMNEAYRQYFGSSANPNLPTRVTVQIVALAEPAFLVEIEATAARKHAIESSQHAQSTSTPPVGETASIRMNTLGPEGEALAARTGLWDVVETSWSQPGAAPEVVRGQVAERRMVGLYLQEILHPGADLSDPKVNRLDYLGFNRVTGRWEYLSMDTRAPVGLMPAWSFDHDPVDRIRVQFEPFAVPGGGASVSGQMLRMEEVIAQSGPDAETKDQYFILADGSGTKWLAHRYAYTRRQSR